MGVLLFITEDLFAPSAPMHIVTPSLWTNRRNESWKGGDDRIAVGKSSPQKPLRVVPKDSGQFRPSIEPTASSSNTKTGSG